MGLEQAREQVDNFATQGAEQREQATPQDSPSAAEQRLLDLNSVEKFKYEGKEWTQKELKEAILRQQDYTKKTQSLSQERQQFVSEKEKAKFDYNLRYDLEQVIANPELADKFREIYPKEYHAFLDRLLPQQQSQQNQAQLPKEVLDKLSKVDQIEKSLMEKDIQVELAQIDSIMDKMSKKYEYADSDTVLAKAQVLSERGTKLTEQQWDELFKENHEAHMGRYKKMYASEFEKQKTANQKGKDTPPGGGVPGQAPVVARTLKEARENAIASLTGGR
jgi:hypothetical protein